MPGQRPVWDCRWTWDGFNPKNLRKDPQFARVGTLDPQFAWVKWTELNAVAVGDVGGSRVAFGKGPVRHGQSHASKQERQGDSGHADGRGERRRHRQCDSSGPCLGKFGSFGHPALKFPAWECLGYLKHPTRHTHFLGGGWGKNPGTLARARRWTSALELFNECAPWVANGFDAMWFGIGKPYMVCLFVCLICSSCMYRCLSQEDGGSSFNHVYTPLIRLAVFFSGRWGS